MELTASQGLQVQWERTGGFAGMRMAATIDAGALSAERAKELRSLIEAASFFDLPTEISASASGTDRFQYTLTIRMDGRSHTVRTSETAAPPKLRSLIQWLADAARK